MFKGAKNYPSNDELELDDDEEQIKKKPLLVKRRRNSQENQIVKKVGEIRKNSNIDHKIEDAMKLSRE